MKVKKLISITGILIILLVFAVGIYNNNTNATDLQDTTVQKTTVPKLPSIEEELQKLATKGYSWYTCEITEVFIRYGPSHHLLKLKDVNGNLETFAWYEKDQQNEMLAVALTAMSLNNKVLVYLNPGAMNSPFKHIRLLKQ